MTAYQEIIDFWFDEKIKPFWFNSTDDFDLSLRERYYDVYHAAKNSDGNSELNLWANDALGALALVIILDQFPLNMFRGLPQSFETEALSREIAKEAISKNFDADLTDEQKAFLYMPYMHSENISDQDESLILFNQQGLETNLRFAKHHHGIIKQFGRFPHRNKILGRLSSELELEYLNSNNAFLG